jgi:hypothetical protein
LAAVDGELEGRYPFPFCSHLLGYKLGRYLLLATALSRRFVVSCGTYENGPRKEKKAKTLTTTHYWIDRGRWMDPHCIVEICVFPLPYGERNAMLVGHDSVYNLYTYTSEYFIKMKQSILYVV